VAGIGRDGHLRCHHAALDEGQTHPEPQQNRQEQNSNAMPGPAFHRAPNMARSDGISKSPQLTYLLKPGWRRPWASRDQASALMEQGVDDRAFGDGAALALRRHVQGTLPVDESISSGGSNEGKPGDGDRVPSGDKKRGIVRTLGGVKGGRNATCSQSRDRTCKSWSRRRAVA
jgi:hypothetical protein